MPKLLSLHPARCFQLFTLALHMIFWILNCVLQRDFKSVKSWKGREKGQVSVSEMSASFMYNLCIMFFTRSRNDFSVCLGLQGRSSLKSWNAEMMLAILLLELLPLWYWSSSFSVSSCHLLRCSQQVTTGHSNSQQFTTVHHGSPQFTTVHNIVYNTSQQSTTLHNFHDSLMILWWFSDDSLLMQMMGGKKERAKEDFWDICKLSLQLCIILQTAFFVFLFCT